MNRRHWQDWINLFLGLWVFISPGVLEYAIASGTGSGRWNLFIVGVAIAVIAAIALIAFRAWEEWANMLLGAWLLVSPWVLGFSTATALMWNAIIVGAIVLVLAVWALTANFGGRHQAPRGPTPMSH